MTRYEFTLPYPPSMNHIWRRGKDRNTGKTITYLTARAKTYRSAVAVRMAEQGMYRTMIACPVRILMAIQAPTKQIRDLSNLPKSIEDALTACGFWLDDSQVEDTRTIWADRWNPELSRVTKRGRVHMIVEISDADQEIFPGTLDDLGKIGI